jgi:hypothetical protein
MTHVARHKDDERAQAVVVDAEFVLRQIREGVDTFFAPVIGAAAAVAASARPRSVFGKRMEAREAKRAAYRKARRQAPGSLDKS